MTDRVCVFHHGRITGVLETARTDQEEIMRYALRLWTAGQPPLTEPRMTMTVTTPPATESRARSGGRLSERQKDLLQKFAALGSLLVLIVVFC